MLSAYFPPTFNFFYSAINEPPPLLLLCLSIFVIIIVKNNESQITTVFEIVNLFYLPIALSNEAFDSALIPGANF